MNVKIIKSKNPKKKFTAIFFNGNGKKIKTTHFGAKGMSDFTIHKNKERREKYITRHKKDLNTNDPTRAGFLSMYVLWGNEPNLQKSIKDYKRRLQIYKKTGKFPRKIKGSKAL